MKTTIVLLLLAITVKAQTTIEPCPVDTLAVVSDYLRRTGYTITEIPTGRGTYERPFIKQCALFIGAGAGLSDFTSKYMPDRFEYELGKLPRRPPTNTFTYYAQLNVLHGKNLFSGNFGNNILSISYARYLK